MFLVKQMMSLVQKMFTLNLPIEKEYFYSLEIKEPGFSKGKAPAYSYQGIITGGTKALDGGLAGQSIGDVLVKLIQN